MTKKSFSVFCDGGSRGNPGPAAIGFLVKDSSGKILAKKNKYIGETTNNVAEYTAVIEALKWISRNREKGWRWVMSSGSGCEDENEEKEKKPTTHNSTPPQITFFLDSKLVVNQLNGLFKIKNANLRNLVIKVRQLEQEVDDSIFYRFIPREKNRLADALVNQIFKKI